MSEKHSTKVPLPELLRAALSTRQPGEDLDEALLRALKAEHPHEAVWLLSAANQMIELEMQSTGEDRDQVVQRLAAAESGPEVTVHTAGLGPLRVSFESTVYRVGGKEYHSLDELPPKIRQSIEAALPPGMRRAVGAAEAEGQPELPGAGPAVRKDDRRPIRMGCSMALLAALWRLTGR